MNLEKSCIYTCLFGDYEKLNELDDVADCDIPRICFTDEPSLTSETWTIRRVAPAFPMDSVRSQRAVKILAHEYLSEFESSLYVDNSVKLKVSPETLLKELSADSDIAAPKHSYRETVLDEFLAVVQDALDDPARIFEQLNHYEVMCPDALQARPHWTAILLRHHQRPEVRKAMTNWYNQVMRYSRRDQLSFGMALRDTGVRLQSIDIDNMESRFHRWPVLEKRNSLKRRMSFSMFGAPAFAQLRATEGELLKALDGVETRERTIGELNTRVHELNLQISALQVTANQAKTDRAEFDAAQRERKQLLREAGDLRTRVETATAQRIELESALSTAYSSLAAEQEQRRAIEGTKAWRARTKLVGFMSRHRYVSFVARKSFGGFCWLYRLPSFVRSRYAGETADDIRTIARSDLFDSSWYRKTYADVATAGIDPARHYLINGGSEGRNPGPWFDSNWYMATNPDVASMGMNPLLHYERFGRAEGRAPSPTGAGDPASSFSRRARSGIAAVRRQIADRGLTNVTQAAIDIYRREGFDGLQRRLKRTGTATGFALPPPSVDNYAQWIKQHDTLTPDLIDEIRVRISELGRKPQFSIVVPTYNSDVRLLLEMIESIKAQIYPHWELCIADDASTDERVREALRQEASSDSRIKVCFRQANGHISEASNSALALATGEFMVLVDHDDLLPRHALFMVAQYINAHPHAQMLYSDEDKLNEKGERTMPYFKSDWNPELILRQNMFSHLGVFDMNVVRKVGGFRKGFEGSQDHDLTLRCMEYVDAGNIVHIPHVLYHWRIVPGSTAGSGAEKPYAVAAAMRAVEEHLSRTHIKAVVEQPFAPLPIIRVKYEVPSPSPRVSIMIPTRDGLALLRQCIDSILDKTTYTNYEIIVVDNGSEQPQTLKYFHEIKKLPNVRVVRDDRPFNFSALNNCAARMATGEFVCLLNNDIEVISPDWLHELVSLAAQPGNGAVGAALWYPNDTLQHGGVVIGLGGVAGHMHPHLRRGDFGYFGRAVIAQNVSAVTAACLLIKKSIYEEVGGMDEELAVAFNDVDFCLRVLEAGYRNVWTPHAELYHHESATRGSDTAPEKIERFKREIRWMENRWRNKFSHDPAYNPNLTLNVQKTAFSLADEPRTKMLD